MSTLDSDISTTRWWWVRHAPVEDAPSGRLSGQFDVNANVSDTKTIRRTASFLPMDAIWLTSHLKRTKQTAQALWDAGAPRAEPEIVRDFAEQAFGAWTNLSWAEIGDLDDPVAKQFWDAPDTTSPPPSKAFAAESFASVCERVALSMDELTQKYAGRDIVCISHAGSIRGAVAHALGLSPMQALALDVQNCALTRLDHISSGLKTKRGGSWRMVGHNIVGVNIAHSI